MIDQHLPAGPAFGFSCFCLRAAWAVSKNTAELALLEGPSEEEEAALAPGGTAKAQQSVLSWVRPVVGSFSDALFAKLLSYCIIFAYMSVLPKLLGNEQGMIRQDYYIYPMPFEWDLSPQR